METAVRPDDEGHDDDFSPMATGDTFDMLEMDSIGDLEAEAETETELHMVAEGNLITPDPGDVDEAPQRVPVNKIEVLSNRLVPGSDGSIEHVVVANNSVTVIRSTSLRGRVRIAKDDVLIGGVSCKILLTGLEARVDTVRHLVGGEAVVHGALFLSKHNNTPVKHYGTMLVGCPKAVVQHLIAAHCAAPQAANLKALAHELDGLFLPFEKLSKPA